MDYGAILKRSWKIINRHKVLWLFGLFAGAMGGGGSSGGSGNNDFSSGSGGSSGSGEAFFRSIEPYIPLIIGAGVLLVLLAIVWWVVSIAAKAGIVHLVNEAEEGRPVRAADGWRVGFSHWGKVFIVEFLTGLPVFLVTLVFVVLLVVIAMGSAGTAALAKMDQAAILSSLAGAFTGMCCVGIVFVLALIVLSVIVVIVAELAVRYLVIKGSGPVEAIKLAWADLRAKRGAFVMYLIQWGVSIAASIVLLVVALIVMIPAAIAFFAGGVPVGAFFAVLGVLVLMLPGAVYAAYYQTVWTLFFRAMTGMQPAGAVVQPGAVMPPVRPAGDYPPPPPSAWQPPADPAPPVDPWKAANDLDAQAPPPPPSAPDA